MIIKFMGPAGFIAFSLITIPVLVFFVYRVIFYIIKFFLAYFFSQLLIDWLTRKRVYFISDFLDDHFSLKNQKRLVFFIIFFFRVYIYWKMIFILMAIIFCSSYIEKK
jgi:hypothetical protein